MRATRCDFYNHSFYLIKLCTSAIWNPKPSTTNDLPVDIAASLHQSFPLTLPSQAQVTNFRVLTRVYYSNLSQDHGRLQVQVHQHHSECAGRFNTPKLAHTLRLLGPRINTESTTPTKRHSNNSAFESSPYETSKTGPTDCHSKNFRHFPLHISLSAPKDCASASACACVCMCVHVCACVYVCACARVCVYG